MFGLAGVPRAARGAPVWSPLRVSFTSGFPLTTVDVVGPSLLTPAGSDRTAYLLEVTVGMGFLTAVLKSDRKYKSIMQTVGSLYKEGGMACFYRGFLPCMLRSTPANGIMLMTVDKVRNYIEAL